MHVLLPANLKNAAMNLRLKNSIKARKSRDKIKELFTNMDAYKDLYHNAISKIEERENKAKKAKKAKKSKK